MEGRAGVSKHPIHPIHPIIPWKAPQKTGRKDQLQMVMMVMVNSGDRTDLVGGLEHQFYFCIYWE